MKKFGIAVVIIILAVIGFSGCGHRSATEVAITQNLNEKEKQMSSQYEEINQKYEEIKRLYKIQEQKEKISKETIEKLETENEQLKEKLQQQPKEEPQDNKNKYQEYIDVKFPKDGNVYVCTDEDVVFYSDEFCSKQIKKPKFSSNSVDETYAKNGFSIYCLHTTENKIVYTTVYVSLEKENEVE